MDGEELNLISDDTLLLNLKKYLNYQLSTFLLYALSFFSIVLIIILTIAAILFIPYVTFVLYKNKKYGWIITLAIIIIIPAILMIVIIQQTYTLFIMLLIELAIFYFYCFSLRLVVNDWVKEIASVKLIEYQRKRREEQYNHS